MKRISLLHFMLFFYVVAALVFWGVSLEKQSQLLFNKEQQLLLVEYKNQTHTTAFQQQLQQIANKRDRRTKQYIAEGSTFLIVILIGATVVFSFYSRTNRLNKQQNNFMLAVTHELKSPLAAIKLNLETLEKRNLDADQQKLLLQRSVTESNRLNDLCNNMLLASQMEGKQYQAVQEKIIFSDLVAQSIQQFSSRFGNRFTLDNATSCSILGDAFLIQLAVHNILDNAVKYAPAATNIAVSVYADQQWAYCSIADEGEGIAAEEQQEVFKKFYRIGNEQVRTKKGTGLGLYLTKKIIVQHKGSIYLKVPAEKGCTFIIKLPLA